MVETMATTAHHQRKYLVSKRRLFPLAFLWGFEIRGVYDQKQQGGPEVLIYIWTDNWMISHDPVIPGGLYLPIYQDLIDMLAVEKKKTARLEKELEGYRKGSIESGFESVLPSSPPR